MNIIVVRKTFESQIFVVSATHLAHKESLTDLSQTCFSCRASKGLLVTYAFYELSESQEVTKITIIVTWCK